MAPLFTDLLAPSFAWIAGLLGISAMAFFLGCASCRQHKQREGADRRPPPPTPETEHNPRYQTDRYPPTPSPSAAYSVPRITRNADNDYEDDFEELPIQIIKDQLNKNTQNSAPSQKVRKAERVTTMRSSIKREGKGSLSDSRCASYENVVNVNGSLVSAPVMRKDHTYLEVFPSDTELELITADKGIATAMRSSVESEGKVSILSQSSLHSYENVVNAHGSPSSASDLESDYVNLQQE
ncbi:uncharacterized protein LOC120943098 isoform X2 [Rana temporaria]|uniref:uncharacterized protein LOC120943098 isoform X2 n=1 Tax=Rana temporaria TaxID=8407 RepID=UPI001AACB460|nr:uncharacterized protein LOC120943098 isoform X2 [Rana temporaria]